MRTRPKRSETLKARIEEARVEIQNLKRLVPHIFPQWQALKGAEADFEAAKAKLAWAKKQWSDL